MMNPAAQHHDLALRLLVGRSLPNGLPWTMEEDRQLIVEERLLWARMTQEEQATEQAALSALWQKRGAVRTVTVNSSWGTWATKLPATATIPDAAFGLPAKGYLPWSKGPYLQCDNYLLPVMQWLWLRGFQIVDVHIDGYVPAPDTEIAKMSLTAILVIPSHRLMQESERLLGLLAVLPGISTLLSPVGTKYARMTLQAKYDPVGGQATLELANVAALVGKIPQAR